MTDSDGIPEVGMGHPDGPIEPIAPLEQPAPAKPPAMLPVQPFAAVPPVQPTPPRASTESTPPEQPPPPVQATPSDEPKKKGGCLTTVAIVVAVAIALAIIGTALGACGSDGEDTAPTPAASPDESPVVELTLDAERSGETLEFSGTTNLPDGAVLLYRITLPADADGGSSLEWTGVVNDGHFEGESPPLNWPVELLVALQMDLDRDGQQPAELIERFGENGEKMRGDTVAWYYDGASSGRRAAITETVE